MGLQLFLPPCVLAREQNSCCWCGGHSLHSPPPPPSTMGELWRSEPMQLVQLFVQIEAAHDTVDELGQLGVIEFRDVCYLVYLHDTCVLQACWYVVVVVWLMV